jgi:hypothetical protein
MGFSCDDRSLKTRQGQSETPHSGEDAMSDPELAAHAQRAALRLEQSWDRWRRLHGLAAHKAQPVSSYVGYSLTEPWGSLAWFSG